MSGNDSAEAASRAQMPEIPDWLSAEGRLIPFYKGESIVCRQDALQYVYIVRSGTVIITGIGENGRENRIVMVSKGGVIGEMEAIVGVERLVYSARAFVDCELVRLPASSFMRWVQTDAQACWELVRVLSEKLYAASGQSWQYTNTNGTQRLVALLLQLGPGKVRYTRQEWAEVCSVSQRTINRSVQTLAQQKLIALNCGKIDLSPEHIERLNDYYHDT